MLDVPGHQPVGALRTLRVAPHEVEQVLARAGAIPVRGHQLFLSALRGLPTTSLSRGYSENAGRNSSASREPPGSRTLVTTSQKARSASAPYAAPTSIP